MGKDCGKSNNNTGVSAPLHFFFTALVLLLLLFNLHQTCQTPSDKSLLIRNRILVSLNTAIQLLTNITLDFYFIYDNPNGLGLVIRTFMTLFLFVACAIGYPFLLHAINAAYRAQNKARFHLPQRVERIWLITIVLFEVVTVIFYIIGFASLNLWPLKVINVTSYMVCVVGSMIAVLALIDVRYSIFKVERAAALSAEDLAQRQAAAAENSRRSQDEEGRSALRLNQKPMSPGIPVRDASAGPAAGSNRALSSSSDASRNTKHASIERKMRIGRRVLNIMVVMIVLVVCGSLYNIYAIIFLSHFMKGELTGRCRETVIDNNGDYISYLAVNLFVLVTFTTWVYTADVKVHPLYTCQHAARDETAFCYTCCTRRCITPSVANERRNTAAETQLSPGKSRQNRNSDKVRRTVETTAKTHVSGFSVTAAQHDAPGYEEDDEEKGHRRDRSVDRGIKVIIYAFDGVITTQDHQAFEHWRLTHLRNLTREQLLSFFGDTERINKLKDHFIITSGSSRLFVLTPDFRDKVEVILERLELLEYFSDKLNETARNTQQNSQLISFTQEQLHKPESPTAQRVDRLRELLSNRVLGVEELDSTQVFILELVKHGRFANDEILYVDFDRNMIDHFDRINLCRTYHVKEPGLTAADCEAIEAKCDFFSRVSGKKKGGRQKSSDN